MGSSSPQHRFVSGVFLLCSLGFLSLFLSSLFFYTHSLIQATARVLHIWLTFFVFQWFHIFGASLTRSFRCLFDEQNILETYQPRARTMGHLFNPDPPTPVPGGKTSAEREKEEKKSAFESMRDQHYADEFQYMQRKNEEMKLMEAKGGKKENAVEKKSAESVRVDFHAPADDDDTEKY